MSEVELRTFQATDGADQELVVATLVDERSREPACVPRRFGIGTLLVVSSAYAMLFAVLRLLDTPWPLMTGVALFLTAIGLVQMVFGPRYVRPVSVITGAVLLPPLPILWALPSGAQGDELILAIALAICSFLPIVAVGAGIGYLGGGLVAGVFLVMQMADDWIHRRSANDESPPLPPSSHPLPPREDGCRAAG